MACKPASLIFAPLLLALLTFTTPGCSPLRETSAPLQTVKRLAKLDFPAEAPHGPDLDIQLIRSEGQLRLVNRTAYNYERMQLWLNRQYVADSGPINIGTDNLRDLTAFINRFEEPYPVGTWLNPDQTARLVHAELYDPRANLRYRVVVRPSSEANIIPFEDLDN